MTIPGPEHWMVGTVTSSGDAISIWDGAGRLANEHGDIYGTAPHRIIPWGKVSIAADRVGPLLLFGWRLRAEQSEDQDFARIERDEAERK